MDLTDSMVRELHRWAKSEIDEKEIHEWAEALIGRTEWMEYGREDPRSVPMEVLSQLDILNQQLIVREDIPAILRFLKQGQVQPLKAWAQWTEYWEALDLHARRSELSGHHHYAV